MTFDDWQGDATFAPWRPDVNRTFFAKRQPRSLVVLIVLRRCGWRQFVLQSRRPATTTRLLSGSARSTRRRGPAWCRLSCKRPRTHNAYSHIPVICNANSDLRPRFDRYAWFSFRWPRRSVHPARSSWCWRASLPDCDAFKHRLQLAKLDCVTNSRAGATALAENYVGLAME